jgi:hypothetical protein
LSLPNWLVSTGGSISTITRPLFQRLSLNKIKLNRWNNGLVIVEMLPPVDTSQFGKDNVRATGIIGTPAAIAAWKAPVLNGSRPRPRLRVPSGNRP